MERSYGDSSPLYPSSKTGNIYDINMFNSSRLVTEPPLVQVLSARHLEKIMEALVMEKKMQPFNLIQGEEDVVVAACLLPDLL